MKNKMNMREELAGENKMMIRDKKRESRFMKLAFFFVFSTAILMEPSLFANATTDTSTITTSFDSFKDIVTAIISSIGTIITLWGISEWGISYQGQDGTMQAQAFKRVAGGMIMILAPQILTILS